MDKMIKVEKSETKSLNTLGVILLSIVFLLMLSACGTVKSKIDPTESQHHFPNSKPLIANVQTLPADKINKTKKQAITQKLMKLQMPFITNEGQVAKEVSFYAKTFGGTAFVTRKGEMVYSFSRVDPKDKDKTPDKASRPQTIKGVTLKETLVGASITKPKGEDRAKTKVRWQRR